MYSLPILPVALNFVPKPPILKADSGATKTYIQSKPWQKRDYQWGNGLFRKNIFFVILAYKTSFWSSKMDFSKMMFRSSDELF